VLWDPIHRVRLNARIVRIVSTHRRRPRQVIPPNLDVVVRELAQLVVVHAQQLGLLGGAELEARDAVDDQG